MTNHRIQHIVLTITPAADESASELRPGARAIVDRFAQIDVHIGHTSDRLTEGGRMMLTIPAVREVIDAMRIAAVHVEEMAEDDPELRRTRIVIRGSHPLVRELNPDPEGDDTPH